MNKLRAHVIFNDASVKLIAIDTVDWRQDKTGLSYQLFARIEPVAVIVSHRSEVYAVDMTARPVALDRFERDIPELARMLHEEFVRDPG